MWYFQVGLRCSDWRVVIDPSPFWASCMLAKPGITVRLTRNVDKPRGFVNGAVGIIQEVFSPKVFSVKLVSNDALVLVHPMWEGGRAGDMFVPCCYGYATTIRRAQGADLVHGCIYFVTEGGTNGFAGGATLDKHHRYTYVQPVLLRLHKYV